MVSSNRGSGIPSERREIDWGGWGLVGLMLAFMVMIVGGTWRLTHPAEEDVDPALRTMYVPQEDGSIRSHAFTRRSLEIEGSYVICADGVMYIANDTNNSIRLVYDEYSRVIACKGNNS